MGMSIKEAIPILHDMYNYYNDTDIDAYIGFDKEDNNVIETALDTMRKYQKIQEIVKQKDYDRFNSHNYYGYFLRVQDIRKVLEDGKID